MRYRMFMAVAASYAFHNTRRAWNSLCIPTRPLSKIAEIRAVCSYCRSMLAVRGARRPKAAEANDHNTLRPPQHRSMRVDTETITIASLH